MWLCLTLLGALLLGAEVSKLVWKTLSLPERTLYAALCGVLLWLASDWALALPHWMTRPLLIGRTLIFLAAALALLARRAGDLARPVTIDRRSALVAAPPLLLIFFWVDYCLWRGAVAPPISFDVLAYHLPKAVLFARAHGFDALRSLRFVFSWRPSNYELLLADVLVSDGSDSLTEWISILFYVVFVVAALALARRWWGASLRALAVVALVTASIPVLLLHAAEYKNDVMAFCFLLGGAVALGRWITDRDGPSLLLAIAAFMAGAGTKTHALIFAALAAPVLLWRLPPRKLAAVIAAALLAFVLLGGGEYVARFFGAPVVASTTAAANERGYGDWSNLWKGPYVLLAAPFSPSDTSLHVPWSQGDWPWRRYELYYSELGIPFVLAALALPLVIRRLPREALIVTIIAFATAALILPVRYVPAGLFLMGLPRFVLFLAPIVFAATIPPLVERFARMSIVFVAVAAVVFVIY